MRSNETSPGGSTLSVTLSHPAAAFAAVAALESMSTEPPRVEQQSVRVVVPERSGAVMEAARRLLRAGVRAEDLVVEG